MNRIPVIDMNSTPFVRQYGILETRGVLFYAKRNTERPGGKKNSQRCIEAAHL